MKKTSWRTLFSLYIQTKKQSKSLLIFGVLLVA